MVLTDVSLCNARHRPGRRELAVLDIDGKGLSRWLLGVLYPRGHGLCGVVHWFSTSEAQ